MTFDTGPKTFKGRSVVMVLTANFPSKICFFDASVGNRMKCYRCSIEPEILSSIDDVEQMHATKFLNMSCIRKVYWEN